MHPDELVRMANQIAAFFEAYPPDEARAGVREHLKKFWEPSMRSQLIVARTELADRLHPLARVALEDLAS